MSAQIIPFDFEEQAVRVVMRGDDPWFVAADVCRVLEITNPSMAVAKLDEDERAVVNLNTLSLSEGIRGNPNTTVISESGLYTVILRSNGALTPGTVQHRFRKWVTAEVLPSIRRTGVYAAPAADPEPTHAAFDGMSHRTLSLNIQAVDLVRKIRGNAAADLLLSALLPMLDGPGPKAPTRQPVRVENGLACLQHILGFELDGGTVDDLLRDPSKSAVRLLAGLGLRPMPTNRLFVANQTHGALFHGTQWAGGLHQAPLRAVPGAYLHAHPMRLAGVGCRGVIVPLFAEVSDAA